MKKFFIAAALASTAILAACNDADVVSANISKDADNFKVQRRITIINGITDNYLLTVTGLCSLGNHDSARELTITCKIGPGTDANSYKKFFAGLSDNVTYTVEQLDWVASDPYHYKVVFKPSVIVPDIEVR